MSTNLIKETCLVWEITWPDATYERRWKYNRNWLHCVPFDANNRTRVTRLCWMDGWGWCTESDLHILHHSGPHISSSSSLTAYALLLYSNLLLLNEMSRTVEEGELDYSIGYCFLYLKYVRTVCLIATHMTRTCEYGQWRWYDKRCGEPLPL